MRLVAGGTLLLVVLALAGSLFIWSGAFNVSARVQDSPVTIWLAGAVRDRSIALRSSGVKAPPLSDPPLVRAGFRNYHGMCAICHAAPGQEDSPIRQGLSPRPPKLDAERTQRRNDAELFWIVTNGIRMTGMPAFGRSHSDEELWSVVAFVRVLPKLKPEEYSLMVEIAGMQEQPGELSGRHHQRQPSSLKEDHHDGEHHEGN